MSLPNGYMLRVTTFVVGKTCAISDTMHFVPGGDADEVLSKFKKTGKPLRSY